MPLFDEALRLGGYVLAHAVWIASDLEDGELICPFAVITRGDQREVMPFEASSQAEAIIRGKEVLEKIRGTIDGWGFAREGLYSVVGRDSPKVDVISVSAWRNGLDEPLVLHQCFVPNSKGTFRLVGPIEITVHGTRSPDDVQVKLRKIVTQGIASHPRGVNWGAWSS